MLPSSGRASVCSQILNNLLSFCSSTYLFNKCLLKMYSFQGLQGVQGSAKKNCLVCLLLPDTVLNTVYMIAFNAKNSSWKHRFQSHPGYRMQAEEFLCNSGIQVLPEQHSPVRSLATVRGYSFETSDGNLWSYTYIFFKKRFLPTLPQQA